MTLTAKQNTPETADGSAKESFLIPIELGLLDFEGKELALSTTDDSFTQSNQVWLVSNDEQSIEFNGLSEMPAISLLRDFSAPVLLTDDLTDEERVLLIGADTNGYNRWEQCQIIYKKLILQKVEGSFDATLLSSLMKSLDQLISDPSVENAVKAELLSLPAEVELLQVSPKVDILAVAESRNALKLLISESLSGAITKVYQSLSATDVYRFDSQSVGQRKLRNELLEYLMLVDMKPATELASAQFANANNMTDQLSALRLLVKYADEGVYQPALNQFLAQWKSDTQVLEQWFRVQIARSDSKTLNRVKALLDHRLFEYQNPNKVRAVIGAFAMGNIEGFHAKDGSGYEFLAEQVATLDSLNPQIAARLVGPLIKWQSYDDRRGLQMKGALEQLSEKDLSKDLYEVVSKSLV